MHLDKTFVVGGVPAGAYCRAISQPGQQYALYLHHSKIEDRNHYYIVTPSNYIEKLELKLPAGSYKADWVDPASGSVVRTDTLTHDGGNRTLSTPTHSVDIALRIKRS